MLNVHYVECPLCWMSTMLNVQYVECPICWMSNTYIECPNVECLNVECPNVGCPYVKCHWVPTRPWWPWWQLEVFVQLAHTPAFAACFSCPSRSTYLATLLSDCCVIVSEKYHTKQNHTWPTNLIYLPDLLTHLAYPPTNHYSTSLYYISLSLGFGNIAQSGDPLYTAVMSGKD